MNVLDLGGGITLEWVGCPHCLDPIPCGHWIGADIPTCQPYPCRCDAIDDDPPVWLREQYGNEPVPRCRPYIGKKGRNAGRWVNFCSCWGMNPEGRPEDCCTHHLHNPYTMHPDFRQGLDTRTNPEKGPAPADTAGGPRADAFTTPGATSPPALPDDAPEANLRSETEVRTPPAGAETWAAVAHSPPPPGQSGTPGAELLPKPVRRSPPARTIETLYADAFDVVDVEPEPYARRWSHAELHCACRTPWDHLITKEGKAAEKGIGFHASCCHTNWRNSAVAAMHKRSITDPCRPPESIVDVERGVMVLRARDEGGFIVWG